MMAIVISTQLLAFLQSVLLGFGLGLLYDLLRALRLRVRRITVLSDGFYCFVSGWCVFLFVLRHNNGQLRGFLLLGLLGGLIVFFCGCSVFLRPIWDFWTDVFAGLLHFFLLPTQCFWNFCKKTALHIKNLFYFSEKYYTMKKTYRKAGRNMSNGKSRPHRVGGGFLIKIIILVMLIALGLQYRTVRQKYAVAKADNERYAAEVQKIASENELLQADIAEGPTSEKMEEIARESLGWALPNEYVFYDKRN